jgi:hypothetical protein
MGIPGRVVKSCLVLKESIAIGFQAFLEHEVLIISRTTRISSQPLVAMNKQVLPGSHVKIKLTLVTKGMVNSGLGRKLSSMSLSQSRTM